MTVPPHRAGMDDEASEGVTKDVGSGPKMPTETKPERRDGIGRLIAPMLIVSGRGEVPWEFAESIHGRCLRWRIDSVLKTIDDQAVLGEVELFPSLILVLSAPEVGRRADSARFRELVGRYRHGRPQSAKEVSRPESKRWYAGGILQVVFPDEALADAVATAVINQACANYSFNALGDVGALFDIYEPDAIPRRDSLVAVRDSVWSELHLWGVDSIDDVHLVKSVIDRQCAVLEDARKYPSMCRPIPGEEMNILQLVLHQPDMRPRAVPGEDQGRVNDTFMDTGSRAIRELIAELRKVLPTFDRPRHRKGKKGSQDDLRKLYDLLRGVIIGS